MAGAAAARAVNRASRFSFASRGFTLIEVLIVITVIGILAGLLFPVFSRVRNSGRAATCSANLKQIGLALQLYVSDNDRRYPLPRTLIGLNCAWPDSIQKYVSSPSTFQCPMTGDEGAYRPGCPDDEILENPLRVFAWNGSYGLNAFSFRSRYSISDARLTHPATTLLALDARATGSGYVTAGYTDAEGRHPIQSAADLVTQGVPVPGRHNGGHNVLFADGHVKRLSTEQLAVHALWTTE